MENRFPLSNFLHEGVVPTVEMLQKLKESYTTPTTCLEYVMTPNGLEVVVSGLIPCPSTKS